MGVRGLTTFMGANPQLFSKHFLHDCNVVVDGNNLCHKLFHDYKIDCYLGGDYNSFHFKVVQYFEAFRKCNIKVYVIFDGAYDVNDRKLRTTVARAKQRISAVKKTSRGVFGHRTLPILALEVFRDVLIEMKVKFAHSDFEADDQIVALANKLQCPVMSQDSDFYIFNIQKGYIPYDSLDIMVRTSKPSEDGGKSYRYLLVQVYLIDKFLSCFESLDRNILPLFGAMLGNDYIDVDKFDQFFHNVRLPKKVDCKFTLGHTHGRMIGLLAWLQEWTAEQAINKVLQYLKTEERKRVREAILTAIEGYNTCRNSLVKHLGLNSTVDSDTEEEQLSTVDNNALPELFCQQFRSGSFPPYFLNALVRRRIFLLTQIEDWSQTSSYTCSLPIRKVIYGILLSLDTQKATSEEEDEKKQTILIIEHAQHAGNLNRSHIQPIFELPQFGPLPKLEDLCNLSSSEQFSLLFEVLKIKNLDFHCSLPEDWQLFLCAMVYCSQSVASNISLQFLNSILLMALYVYFVSGPNKRIKNKNKNQSSTADAKSAKDLMQVIMGASDSHRKSFERLEKYENEPRINNTHPPDIKGLHWYAEFQSCLLFASYFNRLLGLPLPHFIPSHFLNGTFLYNAYQDLKNRPCPDLFLVEILGKGSAVQGMFLEIRDAVLQEVGKEVFVAIPANSRRKSRKKRKTTKKHDQRYPSSSSRSSDCSETKYLVSCELTNKYVNLNVDDNE